jgi:hypothetical protein
VHAVASGKKPDAITPATARRSRACAEEHSHVSVIKALSVCDVVF